HILYQRQNTPHVPAIRYIPIWMLRLASRHQSRGACVPSRAGPVEGFFDDVVPMFPLADRSLHQRSPPEARNPHHIACSTFSLLSVRRQRQSFTISVLCYRFSTICAQTLLTTEGSVSFDPTYLDSWLSILLNPHPTGASQLRHCKVADLGPIHTQNWSHKCRYLLGFTINVMTN